MQNLCQTNMQCLYYHGSSCEGTPILGFLPFYIKGIKSCLWLYLASRGILGAQSNNYWQKTERVSLRRNSRRNTYRSWLNLQLVWREVSGVRSGDDAAISHFPVKNFIEVVFFSSWKLKKTRIFLETFGGLLDHFGFMKQRIHWFYSIFLFCPLTKYWCNKTWSTQFPRIFGNGSVKTSVSNRWYRTFWPQGTDSTL